MSVAIGIPTPSIHNTDHRAFNMNCAKERDFVTQKIDWPENMVTSSKGVEWRVDRVRDRANAHRYHCTYSTKASVGQHVLGRDE
jgi:hypothetical protein